MKFALLVLAMTLFPRPCVGQTFSGVIIDSETAAPVSKVNVRIVEDDRSVMTDISGRFSLTATDDDPKTLCFEKAGYMVEDRFGIRPGTGLKLSLRRKKMSAASLRWQKGGHYPHYLAAVARLETYRDRNTNNELR